MFESVQMESIMYESIQGYLDDIYKAGGWMDRYKYAAACKKIEQALSGEPDVAEEGVVARDPLQAVCTVSEAAERLDTYEVDVRRRIYAGDLRARKSGGSWLVLVDG